MGERERERERERDGSDVTTVAQKLERGDELTFSLVKNSHFLFDTIVALDQNSLSSFSQMVINVVRKVATSSHLPLPKRTHPLFNLTHIINTKNYWN